MNNNRIGLLLCVLLSASAWGGEPAPAKPKIAVVLDDFGLTYKKNPPDEEWMAFDQPLTFAVMPESPRTKKAAKAKEPEAEDKPKAKKPATAKK